VKFWLNYPTIRHPHGVDFATDSALRQIAQQAEISGFEAIGFTDHPAPSHRWRTAGGHDSLDPLIALAHVAATTTTIRLIPNVLVLPYRNPFIVAKSAATLYALAGGRVTLAFGVGYQRSEFAALGVEFKNRNELFDEALHVIRGIWTADDYRFIGRDFVASGQTAYPKPGPIPIWIGGNSPRARQRAADSGDGWAPFRATVASAPGARSTALENLDQLVPLVDDLHRRLEANGRDRDSMDIVFWPSASSVVVEAGDRDRLIDEIHHLTNVGVTWCRVSVPSSSIEEASEAIERYGSEVIAVHTDHTTRPNPTTLDMVEN
jgi:probable F420-dependent oxidoreductase